MSMSPTEVQKASREFCRAVDDLGPLSVWDEIQKKKATPKSVQTDVTLEAEGVEEVGA